MKRELFQTALLVSVVAHLGFFGVSTVWRLPGSEALMKPTEKMFDIRPVELKPQPLTRGQVTQTYQEALKFEGPQEVKGFPSLSEQELEMPDTTFLKDESFVLPEDEETKVPTGEALLLKERTQERERSLEIGW